MASLRPSNHRNNNRNPNSATGGKFLTMSMEFDQNFSYMKYYSTPLVTKITFLVEVIRLKKVTIWRHDFRNKSILSGSYQKMCFTTKVGLLN